MITQDSIEESPDGLTALSPDDTDTGLALTIRDKTTTTRERAEGRAIVRFPPTNCEACP